MKKILFIILCSIVSSASAQTGSSFKSSADGRVVVEGIVVSGDDQLVSTVKASEPSFLKSASVTAPPVGMNALPEGATLINFDDVSAPFGFILTSPVFEQYIAQGVTFSGTGFSILNEDGRFHVSGYSSPNFLAWNRALTNTVEVIMFNPVVSNLSFKVGSRLGGSIYATIYDISNTQIAQYTLSFGDVAQTLGIPLSGIARVVLTVTASAGIIDDLYFERIACPDDITVENDPGECGAVVSYTTPPGTLVSGGASGTFFSTGTTTVTYSEPECSFSVTVDDAEPPVALCKNIELMLDMGGTASITAADIDGGSSDNCSFELSVDKLEFNCANVGPNTVNLTVTDASGNSSGCPAVVTVKERPVVLTYTGDTGVQYSDRVHLSALLTDQVTGKPLEGQYVKFVLGDKWLKVRTNADGMAGGGFNMIQDPCDKEEWVVTVTYEGECPFLGSEQIVPFGYQPEDAVMEYTGIAISATKSMSSNDFAVTLRGVITDFDDEEDTRGNISYAKARFVVEGTPVSDFLPVMLLDNREGTVGMFEFVWEDAISENPATFDVQIELDNCHYTGMSMKYPLTVYNAAGDFITGGGNLWITEAADGFYAPSPGSKMNFGFNVKFNKKGTNLQGKMNIIYCVLNEKGEILKIYQIKSNAMTSMGTNLKNRDALVAEFVSKANLMDVTDVDEFGNGAEIMGNLTLHATMTDQGEPGNMDMIGFSLFNGDPATNPGSLVMSSNWSGTKTAEQVIGGGNLVVHSGAALSTDPPAVDPVSPPKKKSAELSAGLNSNIEVYPNPFNERLMFEFIPAAEGNARIDMYDLTGRIVQTVFKQPVEAGVSYNAEFKPRNDVSGIYLYRITMGNEVFNGRIIYRK